MTNGVKRRLELLEGRAPGKLVAMCTHLETGMVKTAPLRDFLDDFAVWRLDRIIKGNSLKDFDAYLTAFNAYVEGGDCCGEYTGAN